ncbi:hypothetical protein ACIPZ5_02000 [Pseudomonas sp. NPDC089428]|uniref:hypothetical protein n=1 Tax=Pseudomonas sp. NPDC089428 TaxID=3364467 RepID=UPI003805F585
METVNLIATALTAAILFCFIKYYFPKYLIKKAENLATKEDIREITREVEEVKSEISKIDAIDASRRTVKLEACLNALAILDAHFSHIQWNADMKPPQKQMATIREAREAHSKLILTCDDIELVNLFCEILFQKSNTQPLTDQLNKFRNLVRRELGFGGEKELDRNTAWIATIVFSEDPSKAS